jgi:transposase
LITDRNGVPIVAKVTAGQDHESKHFESTMELIEVRRPSGQRRTQPDAIAGDKAFSYPRIRQWIRDHGMKAVIPLRANRTATAWQTHRAFDADAYRDRNVIERCVGWLNECRRIMSRLEKLAVNFLAFVQLAMIERLLRIGLSDRA